MIGKLQSKAGSLHAFTVRDAAQESAPRQAPGTRSRVQGFRCPEAAAGRKDCIGLRLPPPLRSSLPSHTCLDSVALTAAHPTPGSRLSPAVSYLKGRTTPATDRASPQIENGPDGLAPTMWI